MANSGKTVRATAIREGVQLFRKERADLLSKVKTIDAAISGLQSVCEHEWVGTGHDHKYEYLRCTICSLEDKK